MDDGVRQAASCTGLCVSLDLNKCGVTKSFFLVVLACSICCPIPHGVRLCSFSWGGGGGGYSIVCVHAKQHICTRTNGRDVRYFVHWLLLSVVANVGFFDNCLHGHASWRCGIPHCGFHACGVGVRTPVRRRRRCYVGRMVVGRERTHGCLT